MIVVSDTTPPLISLLKTGRLDTLEKLFGEVRIPDAVFEKLTANPRYGGEAAAIRSYPYIDIISVNDTETHGSRVHGHPQARHPLPDRTGLCPPAPVGRRPRIPRQLRTLHDRPETYLQEAWMKYKEVFNK